MKYKLLVLAIAVVSGNCATFTSYPPGFVEPTAPTGVVPKKSVSIAYSQKSIVNSVVIQINPATLDRVQQKYTIEFLNSGYFTSIASALADPDLKVTIEATDNGSYNPAFAFLTGFTLLILPSYATDDFTYVFTFKDKTGKVLKQYTRRVTFETWSEILLIFFMPFKFIVGEMNAARHNIVLSVLEEAYKDGILQ